MIKPHFFKARSRIGIINKPNNQKEFNIGVEDGADSILDNAFLEKVKSYALTPFSFPLPESITKSTYNKILIESMIQFRDVINDNLQQNERQIVIGGDNSISLASLLALIQRHKDVGKIGYIHFDSHGDINQYNESPSKNFHGLYLRPLFDTFDISEIDALLSEKIPTENALFIGNLDLDNGEKKFFQQKNIKTISRKDLLLNPKKQFQEFKDFVHNFEYLHVNFDVDILDKSIFPATGIPSENGFMLEEILTFQKIATKHQNLSFDLSEFNPHKDPTENSKKVAQKIVMTMLG